MVFNMDEVVVTGDRLEEDVNDIPRNVTVITREDIEKAPSNNMVDLLAREAGVYVQKTLASDKKAVVDIRGQGSTATSNVLVLIDGRRYNPVDSSGPDFSCINLSQVERIEVMRGAGGVIYGNGAVGGVINIITRRPVEGVDGRVYAGYGSYRTSDVQAGLRGRKQGFSFSLNAATHDSQGFRDNGQLYKDDFSADLGFEVADWLELSTRFFHHSDYYGLPGSVDRQQIKDRERRRETTRPDDYGRTTDNRAGLGARVDLDDWGRLRADFGARFRENPYDWWGESSIDERTKDFSLLYDNDYRLLGRDHLFEAGVDYYVSDYESGNVGAELKNVVRESGVFVNNRWALSDDLSLRAGLRFDHFHLRSENLDEATWDNYAHDLGLVYSLGDAGSVYASWATSFRCPNVDELGWQYGDIRPQKGRHYEAGVRLRPLEDMELSLALYRVITEDEIYYDGTMNDNYDQTTVRDGLELGARWRPLKSLGLRANYAFIEAKFEESGARVPLVPRHQVNVGADWRIMEPLLLTLRAGYAGSKFNGSDYYNYRYDKIGAYTLVDARLAYEYKMFKFCAGVNNLLDAMYSTLAYGQGYYPMPGRNLYGSVEWNF
ncbi:MAG: TonB-dependent receptor [Desulfovibrionaceae bacterium]|nr:TonB-dependent receptor [Desulfovibrionaceae bacterium]